jgi:hypothetical protein
VIPAVIRRARETDVLAFIWRYPFVFASSNDGKTLTLCIVGLLEPMQAQPARTS